MYKIICIKGIRLPGGASGKEPACQCRRCKRSGFEPYQEDPLEVFFTSLQIPTGSHGDP